MAVRKILEYGNDNNLLKTKSEEIIVINEEIKALAKDLEDTLYNTNGIGLAAPQIGVLKRMIFIDLGDENEPIMLVNPKIVETIDEEESIEGCLSYPGNEGVLKRPKKVIVVGTKMDGKVAKYTAAGLMAKAFCHEIDHLDGIMYMDRATEVYEIEG
jgi:peptide deformylase